MKPKKVVYTSKEIAKLAEVSRGTVDRVLHHRGKVSKEAEEKVNRVLSEVDYRPNALAKALQSAKSKLLVALIPSSSGDEFWTKTQHGIEEANNEFQKYNSRIETVFYDQNDINDFKNAIEKSIQLEPDGLVIVPFFYTESLLLFEKCRSLNIPFVTFNTHIQSKNPLPFVGQNLRQSGMVAASLLDKIIAKSGKILIIHFDEKIENAMHMQEKEDGFVSYFSQNENTQLKIQAVNIQEHNQAQLFDYFDTLFNPNENVVGAFVTTSKSYKLAQYLKQNAIECKLVGYDLMNENIRFIQSGEIDFVIYQNPRQQAYLAATQLSAQLIFNKKLDNETLLPLEIIFKENLNSYIT